MHRPVLFGGHHFQSRLVSQCIIPLSSPHGPCAENLALTKKKVARSLIDCFRLTAPLGSSSFKRKPHLGKELFPRNTHHCSSQYPARISHKKENITNPDWYRRANESVTATTLIIRTCPEAYVCNSIWTTSGAEFHNTHDLPRSAEYDN